jgi:hypothetical protein
MTALLQYHPFLVATALDNQTWGWSNKIYFLFIAKLGIITGCLSHSARRNPGIAR